jgi:hypothetical protein
MTADRPAAGLWAAADRERQQTRNMQKAEWRRRMLHAGHLDTDGLSDQALRILAWLAEWDDWTVDGVAELLAAAHRSGLDTTRPAAAPGTRHSPDATTVGRRAADTPPLPRPAGQDPISARLAALGQGRPENPAVGL